MSFPLLIILGKRWIHHVTNALVAVSPSYPSSRFGFDPPVVTEAYSSSIDIHFITLRVAVQNVKQKSNYLFFYTIVSYVIFLRHFF